LGLIYTNSQPSFSLDSAWYCNYATSQSGTVAWYVMDGPYEDAKTVIFPVVLPSDAVIKRAWLTMTVGSPLSGADYQRINGIAIPSDGVVDVDGVTALSTVFTAKFTFKANGKVFTDTNRHSGNLSIGNPTLHVEYDSRSEGGGDDEPIPSAPDRRGSAVGFPRVLDSSLREIARVEAKAALNLSLTPLSTARLKVFPGEMEVPVRAFVELFTPNESVGIFRVREVENVRGYNAGQIVYLEDALTTLSDDIAIGVQAMSGTFRQVASTLLDAQTTKRWVIGDVDLPDEYELIYEHSYDNLLKAITDLVSLLPDEYVMETDTLSYPWRINIRRLPEEFCECRLNRNMSSAHIIMDSSEQCNRVFAFGAGEGTDRIGLTSLIGSEFLEDAEAVKTWGPVSRTFTNENIFDSITLKAVAEKYIGAHKDPKLSITIDAADIYKATGIGIDHFRLGHACRVALPEYKQTYLERVVAMDYQDVYGDPENVVVTLANKVRVASDEIAKLLREATQSKLLGGSVKTEEFGSAAGGYGDDISPLSPFQQTFEIKGYGNMLAARIAYTCTDEDTGEPYDCHVYVDDNQIDDELAATGNVDILRALATDDNGIPLVGEHKLILVPKTLNTTYSIIRNTIILKTIEKKGGVATKPPATSTSDPFYLSDMTAFSLSDGSLLRVKGGE
jgi:phage minor structural protein